MSDFFNNVFLTYFGAISFSMYLIHTPLMLSLDHISALRAQSVLTQTMIFSLKLIVLSPFSYEIFEKQVYKKLNN